VAHYVDTIASPKPGGQVFDYLADFSSVTEWDPTAVRARMLGDAPGPGTEFEVIVRFAGRELPFVYKTTAFERPRRLVLRAESSTVVSEDTITVRELAGGGSAVTYDADLRPKGLMKLADPLLGVLFERLGDDAAAGLRRELGG
jgi:Polyketide cyclase / dehydrase and lipid transport